MTDDITPETRARAQKIAADMKAKGYEASMVEINALEAAGVDTTGIKRKGTGATSTWAPPGTGMAGAIEIVVGDLGPDPTPPDFALKRPVKARDLKVRLPAKTLAKRSKAMKAAKAARRK